MSTETHLNFGSLEEDVEYTVKTMQYIYSTDGYFYRITVVPQVEGELTSAYYMCVYGDRSNETVIFDKLEMIRKSGQNKSFKFTKQSIKLEEGAWLFILVAGDNDVINLE